MARAKPCASQRQSDGVPVTSRAHTTPRHTTPHNTTSRHVTSLPAQRCTSPWDSGAWRGVCIGWLAGWPRGRQHIGAVARRAIPHHTTATTTRCRLLSPHVHDVFVTVSQPRGLSHVGSDAIAHSRHKHPQSSCGPTTRARTMATATNAARTRVPNDCVHVSTLTVQRLGQVSRGDIVLLPGVCLVVK